MNITEVVNIISAITVVVGIAVSLLNKGIEDTNKRIDDTNKRIDELRQDMDKKFDELRHDTDRRFTELREEIREIRHKVLEVPQKEGKT